MPFYNNSPFATLPVLLQAGLAEYLFGRRTASQADTHFAITSVTDDGTNANFTGTIVEGNIPTIGALFSSVVSNAAYNVVNAPVTATNVNSAGIGTISVASISAGTAATGGTAVIPVPEIPETLVAGFSIPAILPLMGGSSINRQLMAEVEFPTIPTSATVYLQAAMRNSGNEYVNFQQVGTVSGGVVTLSQNFFTGEGMFYRFAVSGVTGTGTIIAKLTVGQ